MALARALSAGVVSALQPNLIIIIIAAAAITITTTTGSSPAPNYSRARERATCVYFSSCGVEREQSRCGGNN